MLFLMIYNYDAKRKCKVEETVSKPKRSFIAYHRKHNDIIWVALDAITPSNMSITALSFLGDILSVWSLCIIFEL